MNHMFYGASSLTSLKELTLGSRFVFGVNALNHAQVEKWQNVGTGSSVNPTGSNVWTSEEFERNYNGATDADTYVWQPQAGGNVTVKYEDTAHKSLAPDVVKSGNVGEAYTTEKKDIAGYTFKEVQGSASGKFTDQAQTVTYVYTKDTSPTEPNKQKPINVYRLYNKKSMQHLYTADSYEYKHLPELSHDWVREGVNFKDYQKSDKTTKTNYRIYNPKSGEHILTADSYEVKVLTTKGWRKEGIAFYAPKTTGKDVYRLFNPKAGIGAHFLTADEYEKSVLTHAPKEWKFEGVAWKAVE